MPYRWTPRSRLARHEAARRGLQLRIWRPGDCPESDVPGPLAWVQPVIAGNDESNMVAQLAIRTTDGSRVPAPPQVDPRELTSTCKHTINDVVAVSLCE